MAYLVLARKYRSARFEDVVGQEPIARTLTAAIEGGRLAQAYLFTGTRGVGKTTMARILAKALNCLSADGPTARPCNTCDACQAIGRGDDLDVIEIDGASNRGIDEIRELRAGVSLHPARCRFKIYYIDEVHQITRDGFNALLKTLEEPPAHVKFIFATTEPERIPATILSRCQRFDFRNIPTRAIAAHLKKICQAENFPAEDDALLRLARAAAGSMRDGVSLLDQVLAACPQVTDEEVVRVLGVTPEERVTQIVRAIAEGKSAAALTELAAVLDAGVAPAALATALGEYFRNLMIAASCGADSELIELTDARRQEVRELVPKFSVPALVQAVGILQRLAFNVRSSALARALVEAAIVRLAEAEKFVDPQGLLEMLEGGASGAGPAPGGAPASRSGAGSAFARPGATSASPGPARAFSPAPRAAAPDAGAPAPPLRSMGYGQAGLTSSPQTAKPAGGAPASNDKPAASAGPPARRPRSADQLKGLSTAEKQEVQNDPAVQATLKLFGGDVVDVRRDASLEDDAVSGAGNP